MSDFKTLWEGALPFEAFVAASDQAQGAVGGDLPDRAGARLGVPGGAARHPAPAAGDRRGLVRRCLEHDPDPRPVRRRAPGMELRILRRDEHPELMDRYLTNGSRSIPIVIALDEDYRELGHWGPRPGVLQAWVMENRPMVPKAELYPQIRKWYARDRGETTLREVLAAAGLGRSAA